MVSGPDLSDEKGQTGPNAVGIIVACALLAAALVFGFIVGRGSVPERKAVPFADRAVATRLKVVEACDGDIHRFDSAVLEIGKPLKPGDATLIKTQLEALGFRGVSVEGVTAGGKFYYYAQGCR